MFHPLHLYVEEAPAAGRSEDVEDDLLALRDAELDRFLEPEAKILYLIVPVEAKDAVEEILQSVLAGKQLLEGRVVCRVKVDLAPESFRDRFFADYSTIPIHFIFLFSRVRPPQGGWSSPHLPYKTDFCRKTFRQKCFFYKGERLF